MGIKYSGKQAVKYAQFANESFSWNFLEKPAIEKNLGPLVNSHKRVLDAGCGTGRSTRLLIDLGFAKEKIIASDISPSMLEIARKEVQGVNFIESNLANLDFGNNTFDIVLSNMVLHYLDNETLRNVVEKFYRWLDKGGILLFITVHPFRFPENYSQYFDNNVKKEKTPWGTIIDYYPKKISDYVNAVIKSGFEILSLDEPQPPRESKEVNLQSFQKYSSIPTRLIVKARKS